MHGTKKTENEHGMSENLLREDAQNVISYSQLKHIIKNIVVMLANLEQEGSLELIMKDGHALFAIKNLWQTNIPSRYVALGLVQTVIESKPKKVYDITVEKAHEFFADGILVSNCDALRYSLEMYNRGTKAGTINNDLARIIWGNL